MLGILFIINGPHKGVFVSFSKLNLFTVVAFFFKLNKIKSISLLEQFMHIKLKLIKSLNVHVYLNVHVQGDFVNTNGKKCCH